MADAAQFEKVRSIVTSDESRRVVVVSAAGKRYKDDHKVTDLLYLCYAHLQYGVSCDGIYQMICDRYLSIRDELGLRTDLEGEFAALRRKMDQGISQDELVSRGEYFAAKLMADYLGFDFLDSTMWLKFRFDGSVDQEASYEALQHAASGRRVVMPGFYGVMPDGAIKTFTRGGSDITGALAAAALDADVYENWTDVSGFLMADPRIVEDPQPIERITYSELRELSYIGAQVLHEGTIFPVREKNIPLNIRNTNQPDNPGTMIRESFDETEQLDHRFITGIAGRKHFSVITITKTGMSSENGSRCSSATASTSSICPPASTTSRSSSPPRRPRPACISCSASCRRRSSPTPSTSRRTSPSSPPSAVRWPISPAAPVRSSPRSAKTASTSA